MIIGAEWQHLVDEYVLAREEESFAIKAVIPSAHMGEAALLEAVRRMEESHKKAMDIYDKLQAVALDNN